MRIIIMRHGESEADILGVHEGRADFSLTKLEKAQVKNTAPRKTAQLIFGGKNEKSHL